MNCPIGKEQENCIYLKDGRCDYPYKEGLSAEEIKVVSRKFKGGPGDGE